MATKVDRAEIVEWIRAECADAGVNLATFHAGHDRLDDPRLRDLWIIWGDAVTDDDVATAEEMQAFSDDCEALMDALCDAGFTDASVGASLADRTAEITSIYRDEVRRLTGIIRSGSLFTARALPDPVEPAWQDDL